MSSEIALEMKSIQELVEDSEVAIPTEIKRSFEYNLNAKAAKSKLLKGAKRVPFEIVHNSTSSNLIFSVGAWNHVVLPTIKYWNTIKGNKTCNAGMITVKVASVSAGEEAGKKHIGTLVCCMSFVQHNSTYSGKWAWIF